MKWLNPYTHHFSPLVLAIALALSYFGAAAPALSDHDRVRSEIRQFHVFLKDHPKVSSELRGNPNLVKSKKYLAKHDDLAKFLKRYPTVRTEIVNHPTRVFGRSYREDHPHWHHR